MLRFLRLQLVFTLYGKTRFGKLIKVKFGLPGFERNDARWQASQEHLNQPMSCATCIL